MHIEQPSNTELHEAEDNILDEVIKHRCACLSQVSYSRRYFNMEMLEQARDSLLQQGLIKSVASHADWPPDKDPLWRCYEVNV